MFVQLESLMVQNSLLPLVGLRDLLRAGAAVVVDGALIRLL